MEMEWKEGVEIGKPDKLGNQKKVKITFLNLISTDDFLLSNAGEWGP